MKNASQAADTDRDQAGRAAAVSVAADLSVAHRLDALPENEKRRARESLLGFVAILRAWEAAETAVSPALSRIGSHDPAEALAVHRFPTTGRPDVQA